MKKREYKKFFHVDRGFESHLFVYEKINEEFQEKTPGDMHRDCFRFFLKYSVISTVLLYEIKRLVTVIVVGLFFFLLRNTL